MTEIPGNEEPLRKMHPLAGVASLPALQVPLGAFGAMPLELNAYIPCPVAPAYEPVLLPERTL